MSKKTIEILLKARNMMAGPVGAAKAGLASLWDGTVGRAKRAWGAVMNLKNAVAGFAAFQAAKFVLTPGLNREKLQKRLGRLLGDVDKAKVRFQELEGISSKTDFTLDSVARASVQLETLTSGALSGGAGLRMVADMAAVAQEPIDQLATHVGRLYGALKTDRAAGEPLMRLQELGLLGESRDEIEAMIGSSMTFADRWARVTEIMGRFDGMALAMSDTGLGKFSTFFDNAKQGLADSTEDIIPILKRELDELIQTIERYRADGTLEEWGRRAADNIESLLSAAKTLVGWLMANQESLKNLGLSVAAIMLMRRLTIAVGVMTASWKAWKAATAEGGDPSPMIAKLAGRVDNLKGALKALPAVATTAFVGWQVGKSLAEIEAVNNALTLMAEKIHGVAGEPDDVVQTGAVGEVAIISAFHKKNEGSGKSAAEIEAEALAFIESRYKRQASERAKAKEAAQKQLETEEKIAEVQQDRFARKAAQKELQVDAKAFVKAAEKELQRRENIARLEAQLSEAKHQAILDNWEKGWQAGLAKLTKALEDAELDVTVKEEAAKQAQDALSDVQARNRRSTSERIADRRAEREKQREDARQSRRNAAIEEEMAKAVRIRDKWGDKELSDRQRQLVQEHDLREMAAKRQLALDEARINALNAKNEKAQGEAQVEELRNKRDADLERGRQRRMEQKIADAKATGGDLAKASKEELIAARDKAKAALVDPKAKADALLAAKFGLDSKATAVALANVQAAKDQGMAAAMTNIGNQQISELQAINKTLQSQKRWDG